MANGKRIGNAYEREFSGILSFWLTGDPLAEVCWRDIGSGARATVRAKKGLASSRTGDIVATDLQYQPFFDRFFIDTKSFKAIELNFFRKTAPVILGEWIKVRNDAQQHNKVPWMPVKVRQGRGGSQLLFTTILGQDSNPLCTVMTYPKENLAIYDLQQYLRTSKFDLQDKRMVYED